MPDPRPLEGLRALVIEDEYFIAEDLKQMLKRQGASIVKLSGSVDDALKQIEDEGFEFGLLDINIRGEVTFLVADALRRKAVPFAFVSGCDRRSIPLRFDKVPNWGKPYDAREIVDGIRSLWTRPTAFRGDPQSSILVPISTTRGAGMRK